MTPFRRQLILFGAAAVIGCVLGKLLVPGWSGGIVGLMLAAVAVAVCTAFAVAYATQLDAAARARSTPEWPTTESVAPTTGGAPKIDETRRTEPPDASWTPPNSNPTPPVPQAPALQLIESEPVAWWLRTLTPPVPPTDPPTAPPVRFDPRRARIAQCPRCGSYDLSGDRQADEYRFGCVSCGYAWHWSPGTRWPDFTIDPTRRRHADRVDRDVELNARTHQDRPR